MQGRDRIGDAVARARRPDPPRREVAEALFCDHLDLAAIRKALGQPNRPVSQATPAPESGDGAASDPGEATVLAETQSPAVVRLSDPVPSLARGMSQDVPPDASRKPGAGLSAARRRGVAALCILSCIVVIGSVVTSAYRTPAPAGPAPEASTAAPVLRAPSDSPLRDASSLGPFVSTRGATPSSGRLPAADRPLLASQAPIPPVELHGAETRRIDPIRVSVWIAAPAQSPQPRATPAHPNPATTVAAAPSAPRPVLSSPQADPAPRMETALALPSPVRSEPPAARPAADPPVTRHSASGPRRAVVHYDRRIGAIRRDGIEAALRSAGFQSVEWRGVSFAVGRTQTRYFHAGDRPLSERAAAAFAATGHQMSQRDFTHFTPPTAHQTIEIWLDNDVAGRLE